VITARPRHEALPSARKWSTAPPHIRPSSPRKPGRSHLKRGASLLPSHPLLRWGGGGGTTLIINRDPSTRGHRARKFRLDARAQWDQLPSCRCTKAPHPRPLPIARAGGSDAAAVPFPYAIALPRKRGTSTSQLHASIAGALEYWVARIPRVMTIVNADVLSPPVAAAGDFSILARRGRSPGSGRAPSGASRFPRLIPDAVPDSRIGQQHPRGILGGARD
jgi:hypothetical protein